jgi:hypothetical protein
MHKVMIFAAGIAVGIAAASLNTWLPVLAQAATPSGNGDINGDGQIDIADAVTLLNWLFRGGTPPVPIDCDEPPTGKAMFRILNDLVCDNVAFPARLDVCGGTATDSFDPNNTATACVEVDANPGCAVKLTASTQACGDLEICGVFNAAPGRVYDFVLTVLGDGRLVLGYLDQAVQGDGQCPPFPQGGSFAGEIAGTCIPGAAGAGGARSFTAAGWGR